MKALLCSLLVLTTAATAAPSEPDAPSPDAVVRWHIYDVHDVLRATKYPVKFKELFEEIGGEKVLTWQVTTSHIQKKTARHLMYFEINQASAHAWPCQIEFELDDVSGDIGQHDVLKARICYQSPIGLTFYLDEMNDLEKLRESEKKTGANQRPDGTSAETPPSNPSQGAAVPHP